MLQEALEVGADYAVKPEDLGSLLYNHGLNVDTAYDFVGVGSTFQSVLEHIRPRGTVIIVGLGATCVELPLVPVTRKEVTIKASLWGTKKELEEVLVILKDKKVIETRHFVHALEAFEDLKNSKLKGRVVMVL